MSKNVCSPVKDDSLTVVRPDTETAGVLCRVGSRVEMSIFLLLLGELSISTKLVIAEIQGIEEIGSRLVHSSFDAKQKHFSR